MKKMHQFFKKYKLYYLLLLPVAYVIFYLNTSSGAMPEVATYLSSSSHVTVTQEKVITFKPQSANGTGIVFYPGGKVKPEAYAPLLSRLAEEGYTCYLVKMPFNLAVFDIKAALEVVAGEPDVKQWYIGGHSLGGAMAAQVVHDNPDLFKGIFFLASYPTEGSDLSQVNQVKSLSLYGEKDLLVGLDRLEEDKARLPKNQVVEVIKGANHGQFGYYGLQKGDGEATIERERQQQLVLDYLIQWLK